MIKTCFQVESNSKQWLEDALVFYVTGIQMLLDCKELEALASKLEVYKSPINENQVIWQLIEPLENRSLYIGYLIGHDLSPNEIMFMNALKGVSGVKQI